jgi:hypothetical protein
MGACAGDIDNDGLIDLYITNVGSNVLYRNMGHGRFTEVPHAGGANPKSWSTAIGRLHLSAGRYTDAVVALARAVSIQPSRAEAVHALGMALAATGRTAEAARHLKTSERCKARPWSGSAADALLACLHCRQSYACEMVITRAPSRSGDV